MVRPSTAEADLNLTKQTKIREISKEVGLDLSSNGNHPISGHLKVDVMTGAMTIVVDRIDTTWLQSKRGEDAGSLKLDYTHRLRFPVKPNQCSQLETAGVTLCKEQTRTVEASSTAYVTIEQDVTFYAGYDDSVEAVLGELEPDDIAPIYDWDCSEFDGCAVLEIDGVKDAE